MTDEYVISLLVTGFMPLDPPDPPTLDRKRDDRDPKDVEAFRKRHRELATEQRRVLLAQTEAGAKGKDLVVVDAEIRDDGMGYLFFRFDPDADADGVYAWDAALRDHVEEARSTLAGSGLHVIETRIIERETPKAKPKAKAQS